MTIEMNTNLSNLTYSAICSEALSTAWGTTTNALSSTGSTIVNVASKAIQGTASAAASTATFTLSVAKNAIMPEMGLLSQHKHNVAKQQKQLEKGSKQLAAIQQNINIEKQKNQMRNQMRTEPLNLSNRHHTLRKALQQFARSSRKASDLTYSAICSEALSTAWSATTNALSSTGSTIVDVANKAIQETASAAASAAANAAGAIATLALSVAKDALMPEMPFLLQREHNVEKQQKQLEKECKQLAAIQQNLKIEEQKNQMRNQMRTEQLNLSNRRHELRKALGNDVARSSREASKTWATHQTSLPIIAGMPSIIAAEKRQESLARYLDYALLTCYANMQKRWQTSTSYDGGASNFSTEFSSNLGAELRSILQKYNTVRPLEESISKNEMGIESKKEVICAAYGELVPPQVRDSKGTASFFTEFARALLKEAFPKGYSELLPAEWTTKKLPEKYIDDFLTNQIAKQLTAVFNSRLTPQNVMKMLTQAMADENTQTSCEMDFKHIGHQLLRALYPSVSVDKTVATSIGIQIENCMKKVKTEDVLSWMCRPQVKVHEDPKKLKKQLAKGLMKSIFNLDSFPAKYVGWWDSFVKKWTRWALMCFFEGAFCWPTKKNYYRCCEHMSEKIWNAMEDKEMEGFNWDILRYRLVNAFARLTAPQTYAKKT